MMYLKKSPRFLWFESLEESLSPRCPLCRTPPAVEAGCPYIPCHHPGQCLELQVSNGDVKIIILSLIQSGCSFKLCNWVLNNTFHVNTPQTDS